MLLTPLLLSMNLQGRVHLGAVNSVPLFPSEALHPLSISNLLPTSAYPIGAGFSLAAVSSVPYCLTPRASMLVGILATWQGQVWGELPICSLLWWP